MATTKSDGDVSDAEHCNFHVLTLRSSSMVWINGEHPHDAGASNGDEDNLL
jgi:hypothetical protein